MYMDVYNESKRTTRSKKEKARTSWLVIYEMVNLCIASVTSSQARSNHSGSNERWISSVNGYKIITANINSIHGDLMTNLDQMAALFD